MVTVSIYLQDLYNKYPSLFDPPEIEDMLEFQWNIFIETEKKVSTIRNMHIITLPLSSTLHI